MRERKSRIDTCGSPTAVRVAVVSHQPLDSSCDTKIMTPELFLKNDSPMTKLDYRKMYVERERKYVLLGLNSRTFQKK